MAASVEFREELDRIASIVVDRALFIHRKLGPGLLESAYLRILAHELRKAGLSVSTEVEVPLVWDDKDMGTAYRADLIIEGKFAIELKATEKTQSDLFARQLKTYLVLLDYRLGMVINFGARLLKDGIERVANDF
jgi:GxxExxY protein